MIIKFSDKFKKWLTLSNSDERYFKIYELVKDIKKCEELTDIRDIMYCINDKRIKFCAINILDKEFNIKMVKLDLPHNKSYELKIIFDLKDNK